MEIKTSHFDKRSYRLKLKWKTIKGDITNGGYCEENMHKFLSKVRFIL